MARKAKEMSDKKYKAIMKLEPWREAEFRAMLNYWGHDIEMYEDGDFANWDIVDANGIPLGGWVDGEVRFVTGERYPATDIMEVIDALNKFYENQGIDLKATLNELNKDEDD